MWMGLPSTEQFAGTLHSVPNRKQFEPPKHDDGDRPTHIYCCVWPDGTTKVWLTKGPWDKLRKKVKKAKWPESSADPDGTKSQPRFFVGVVDWWQFWNSTEESDGD